MASCFGMFLAEKRPARWIGARNAMDGMACRLIPLILSNGHPIRKMRRFHFDPTAKDVVGVDQGDHVVNESNIWIELLVLNGADSLSTEIHPAYTAFPEPHSALRSRVTETETRFVRQASLRQILTETIGFERAVV